MKARFRAFRHNRLSMNASSMLASIILLGIWTVGLTVWQLPRVHPEVRLWAGLLTIGYVVLIFIVLGGDPRFHQLGDTSRSSLKTSDIAFAVCAILSLAASTWLLGRVSLHCKRICYIVFTIGNAGVCGLLSSPELAIGLLLVAVLMARQFTAEWLRNRSLSLRAMCSEFSHFTDSSDQRSSGETVNRGQFLLIGLMSGLLACLLIGTVAFSLRFETVPKTQDSRYGSLPSRSQLEQVNARQRSSDVDRGLFDLMTGQRADLLVLVAVIFFLSLQIMLNELPRRPSTDLAMGRDSMEAEV